MTKTEKNKERILEALKASRGLVTLACEATNLSRSQFYKWLQEDPDFSESVEEVRHGTVDHVTSKLFERIDGVTMRKQTKGGEIIYDIPPDTKAITFYLQTIGKDHGFTTRNELTGKDGAALVGWQDAIKAFISFREQGGLFPEEIEEDAKDTGDDKEAN